MLIENKAGNYSFLPAAAPYSAAVIASPGHQFVRVTLLQPVPIRGGLTLIESYLAGKGHPIATLCALELRCPSPHSFSGFAEFNDEYREILVERHLLLDGANPIARTNVAPAPGGVVFKEPSIYAFAYSAPSDNHKCHQCFIISGAGELLNSALEPNAIVRPGETSEDALREKAALVMQTMKTRLVALNSDWSQVTSVHIYTAHQIHRSLQIDILGGIGRANDHGIRWYNARPPVSGIEFEMDVRAVRLDCITWLSVCPTSGNNRPT
jgi:hypothetical protein